MLKAHIFANTRLGVLKAQVFANTRLAGTECRIIPLILNEIKSGDNPWNMKECLDLFLEWLPERNGVIYTVGLDGFTMTAAVIRTLATHHPNAVLVVQAKDEIIYSCCLKDFETSRMYVPVAKAVSYKAMGLVANDVMGRRNDIGGLEDSKGLSGVGKTYTKTSFDTAARAQFEREIEGFMVPGDFVFREPSNGPANVVGLRGYHVLVRLPTDPALVEGITEAKVFVKFTRAAGSHTSKVISGYVYLSAGASLTLVEEFDPPTELPKVARAKIQGSMSARDQRSAEATLVKHNAKIAASRADHRLVIKSQERYSDQEVGVAGTFWKNDLKSRQKAKEGKPQAALTSSMAPCKVPKGGLVREAQTLQGVV